MPGQGSSVLNCNDMQHTYTANYTHTYTCMQCISTNTHSGTPKGVPGVGFSVFNHTHILTHSLTQCSLSPGNFERGARGRLVCLGVVCPLVNNPRGRLVCLHLVCPMVTSRGVPGEGLFVLDCTHAQTHTLVPQKG